jgi:hypothetical protein
MMTNCSKGPDVTSLIKEKIRIPISQRQFDWLNNKYTLDQVSELLGFFFQILVGYVSTAYLIHIYMGYISMG